MILGTIKTLDGSKGLTILVDGEDEPTTKNYKYLNSYYPKVGDRVIIEEISGSYVIMGAVTSDFSTTSSAKSAETAATAATATKATTATNATNATNATTAGTCTGNSATATKLATSRKITVHATVASGGGTYTGSAYFDGSGDIYISMG